MSNVLAISEDRYALMPVMDTAAAINRRAQIVQFTKSIMIDGTDFGKIPGTGDKPTLLKPGAEKLTTFFGLSKRFEIIERSEDWTGKQHDGEPFFYYLYRCQLYRGDMLIAEADGSCSSFEAKYRWRKSERKCPNCGAENIRKSKQGGWYCWQKTGGCGATFKDGDQAIESQEVGRIPNPDVCDQVNTIQKMAQKRALIAATLLAVNASEFFTQDLEDFEGVIVEAQAVVVERPAQPEQPRRPRENTPPQPAINPAAPRPFRFGSIKQEEFYKTVQTATENYYTSPHHLFATLGTQGFNWTDQDLWDSHLSSAVDHWLEKKAEAA